MSQIFHRFDFLKSMFHKSSIEHKRDDIGQPNQVLKNRGGKRDNIKKILKQTRS